MEGQLRTKYTRTTVFRALYELSLSFERNSCTLVESYPFLRFQYFIYTTVPTDRLNSKSLNKTNLKDLKKVIAGENIYYLMLNMENIIFVKLVFQVVDLTSKPRICALRFYLILCLQLPLHKCYNTATL